MSVPSSLVRAAHCGHCLLCWWVFVEQRDLAHRFSLVWPSYFFFFFCKGWSFLQSLDWLVLQAVSMVTAAAASCMCVPVTLCVCDTLIKWGRFMSLRAFDYASSDGPLCVHLNLRRWRPSRGRCLTFWATSGLPSWPTSCTLWPSSWACLALCSFASDTSFLWVPRTPTPTSIPHSCHWTDIIS